MRGQYRLGPHDTCTRTTALHTRMQVSVAATHQPSRMRPLCGKAKRALHCPQALETYPAEGRMCRKCVGPLLTTKPASYVGRLKGSGYPGGGKPASHRQEPTAPITEAGSSNLGG